MNAISRPFELSSQLCLPLLTSALLGLTGCAGNGDDAPKPSAFELRFAVTANGQEIGCKDRLAGLGPQQDSAVGISDLRFYVSNLRLTDAKGQTIDATLDENQFQYTGRAGSVTLIDATGNTKGSCASSAAAQGTARTNLVLTGTTQVEQVTSVSFEIGVPAALAQETIATNTPEGAPSPLNEMFWTWATGYRHFLFDFAVEDGAGAVGEGHIHVGSRDCGPEDGLALEDRDACSYVNTPQVALQDFDLTRDAVSLELAKLLAGVDLLSPVYDPDTFEELGEGPGVECHSAPAQPDCAPLFSNLGLDLESGAADTSKNDVFVRY